MRLEPTAAVGFVFANLIADLGVKNFGSAACATSQACVDHVLEDPTDRLFRLTCKPIDFDGCPGFEVQRWEFFVQQTDDVAIPLVLCLVVESSDDVHFGRAGVDGLLSPGKDLLVGHGVAFGVTQVGAKRTERTAIDADVGWVEMGVDVVVGEITVFAFADQVGQLAQFGERDIGAVEQHAIVEREAFARFDFFADGF